MSDTNERSRELEREYRDIIEIFKQAVAEYLQQDRESINNTLRRESDRLEAAVVRLTRAASQPSEEMQRLSTRVEELAEYLADVKHEQLDVSAQLAESVENWGKTAEASGDRLGAGQRDLHDELMKGHETLAAAVAKVSAVAAEAATRRDVLDSARQGLRDVETAIRGATASEQQALNEFSSRTDADLKYTIDALRRTNSAQNALYAMTARLHWFLVAVLVMQSLGLAALVWIAVSLFSPVR